MRVCGVPVLAILLLASAGVSAQTTPDTPEQSADRALAAFSAGDAEVLKALAAKDDPDPWLVADELCSRGEHDAADAFARHAPRKDTERLPDYVASRRGMAPDAAVRRSLADANAALAETDWSKALKILSASAPDAGGILAVRWTCGRGLALRGLNRQSESVAAFDRAAEAAGDLRWLARECGALQEAGWSAFWGADYNVALERRTRCLALCEIRGDRTGMARALGSIGHVHSRLGDYPEALSAQKQALALMESLGDRAGVAWVLGNIGNVCLGVGDYPEALSCHERSLAIHEELDDRSGVLRALANIGLVHANLGDYPRALAFEEQALAMLEASGNRAGAARVLSNIGLRHLALGDYAKALSVQERALAISEQVGDRSGVAETLGYLGSIRCSLSDYRRALPLFQRAMDIHEQLGERKGSAIALLRIGEVHEFLGENSVALAFQERALAIAEDIGDRSLFASTLGSIGVTQRSLGDFAKALSYQERALSLMEGMGRRAAVAELLGAIGATLYSAGDFPKALTFLDRAVRETERRRLPAAEVACLTTMARVHLGMGNGPQALRDALRGLPILEKILGGLAEDESATARGGLTDLFGVGTLAASRLPDAAQMTAFLESGRAGALLETLGGRQAMAWREIPEELRAGEATARAAERKARFDYDRALRGGDLDAIRRTGKALDEAFDLERESVARIQREAKRAAGLLYPRAATMEEIQGWLDPGEVLVLYGLCLGEALALVLAQDSEKIVNLGKAADVVAACETLRPGEGDEVRGLRVAPAGAVAGADGAPPLAKLKALLVDPLGLPAAAETVLVSPEGALNYVPWAALFDVPVSCVPSGTTLALLRDEQREPGKGVLALGDPDYGSSDAGAVVAYGGSALAPLPGTKEEAQAVGDVVLLGAEASEPGFAAALGKRKRWRAVHFACHGLVKPEKPTLSSLALSRAGESDGFLTCLEVLRMRIPADLAVLSACETGKGKIVQGEGIVGLTRAFMYAGAPRVLCSLWKVDDAATKSLMVKFYELWNPKEGAGLPAAEALRKAQESVRSQDQWKDPEYWAAWVLWGLPD
jgi:tetratricopeptide (TPR) repeat protein